MNLLIIFFSIIFPFTTFADSYPYESTGGFIVNIISETEILITDPSGDNSSFSVEHGFYDNNNLSLTGGYPCSVNIPCKVIPDGASDWDNLYSDRGQRYAQIWANNPNFPDCAYPFNENCSHLLLKMYQKPYGNVVFNILTSQTSGIIYSIVLLISQVVLDNKIIFIIGLLLFIIFWLLNKLKGYLS